MLNGWKSMLGMSTQDTKEKDNTQQSADRDSESPMTIEKAKEIFEEEVSSSELIKEVERLIKENTNLIRQLEVRTRQLEAANSERSLLRKELSDTKEALEAVKDDRDNLRRKVIKLEEGKGALIAELHEAKSSKNKPGSL
ncbi:MAG: hypothetical protein BGO43_09560 [Gammaproteobacteria bacterium 39-13]|nr:hypothetical protein [Gammaproteobacteria bacterium]OJV93887.1 MAG: hypothetical protein BGO43_09560 [Gammaproteobacteria bacterium 39-13]